MPIDNYFEIIDDFVQYADDGKQPYTDFHLIKNA